MQIEFLERLTACDLFCACEVFAIECYHIYFAKCFLIKNVCLLFRLKCEYEKILSPLALRATQQKVQFCLGGDDFRRLELLFNEKLIHALRGGLTISGVEKRLKEVLSWQI